nr:ANTAR domain-containing protein [Streptomyces canus]
MIDGSQEMSGPLPAAPRTDGPCEGVPTASAGALEVRNRQLARAAVEPAQRILVHRYRLARPAEGFELLKQTSQRFNIKLHTLADAVVRIAGPDAGAVMPISKFPQCCSSPQLVHGVNQLGNVGSGKRKDSPSLGR